MVSHPTIQLDLSSVVPWEHNPRKRPDAHRIKALAENLRVVGQAVPVLCRVHPQKPGYYQLADGSRRFAAAKLAGFTSIEARVRELTDEEMFAIALSTGSGENTEPLAPLDEAAGYADAMKMLGISQVELARRLGISRSHIQRRVALLDLPEEAKEAVASGELPIRTAWLIARVPGKEAREAAALAVIRPAELGGVMPSREAEVTIARLICRPLQGAPFDQEDAELVPAAGKCSACPHRAGNSPDLYGETKPDTCMSPSCYAAKVEAARERLCAAAAADGKKRLAPEINAKVFPAGALRMDYRSEYVEYSKPPSADLLKPEVAAGGKVPSWSELCSGGPASVQVYIGFDQQGRAVDLVNRSEAIAAADLNEKAIFSDTVTRKQQLRGAPESSPREKEVAAAKEREKAQKAQAKKDRGVCKWLVELHGQLEDLTPAPWSTADYWQKIFALQLPLLTEEELRLVGESVFGEQDEPFTRDRLAEGARAIANDSEFPGPAGVAALVTVMLLVPRVRAEGLASETVKAWHAAYVLAQATPAAATEAPPKTLAPRIAPAESRRFAEMLKAKAAGMSPQRIAESFKTTLEDVCGALEMDVRQARNQVTQLRQDCEEWFAKAGLNNPTSQNNVTRTATGRRVQAFADLKTPEDFHSVLRILSHAGKTPPPSKPAADEDDR